MSAELSKLFRSFAPPRGRVILTNRTVAPRRIGANRRRHDVRVGQIVYALERGRIGLRRPIKGWLTRGQRWKTVPYVVIEIDDCARWYRSTDYWQKTYGVKNALEQSEKMRKGWCIYYWCMPIKQIGGQWRIVPGGFGHGASLNDEFYLSCAECNFSKFGWR